MSSSHNTVEMGAFVLTPELLGDVTLYKPSPEMGEAWTDLLRRYRDHTGSQGNLPYTTVMAALRSACRTHVNVQYTNPERPPALLVSHQPLDPADVHDAFTVFEQAILDVPDDAIRFSYPSPLAEAAARTIETAAETHALADHLSRRGRQPDADGWVWDVATWQAAHALAQVPWSIEGLDVCFRIDTDGDMVVWDPDLLWHVRGRTDNADRYATLRVRLRMKTMPYLADPILVVNPSVTRLSPRLGMSRSAWLEPADPDAPLLVLKTRQGVDRLFTATTLTVLRRLRGEPPVAFTDDLTGTPGRLRAVVARSMEFAIGQGVGMYTQRELHSHVTHVLGAPAVTTRTFGHQFPRRPKRKRGRDEELVDPTTLPETIQASGCERLRIVVLYATVQMRRRIQNLLAYHFDISGLADHEIRDGDEVDLANSVVSAVFAEASELLAHGSHEDRRKLVAEIDALEASDGTRVVALFETEYDAAAWTEARRQSRRDRTVRDPYEDDAKPYVVKLLAEREVVTQSLVPHEPAGPDPTVAEDEPEQRLADVVLSDHRGHSAVADLLRSAGLVHPRIGEALERGKFGLKAPSAFVGLHIRQQHAGRGRFQLVCTLAALVPAGSSWTVLGYRWGTDAPTDATGWCTYADANAAFRSRPYPEGSRRAEQSNLSRAVDSALSQLRHRLNGTPYVLIVGEGCRQLWPGLANKHLDRPVGDDGLIDGRAALPGRTTPPPIAIVRVTPDQQEIPRPIPKGKPLTTQALLEVDGLSGSGRLWILSNVPHQFRGAGRKESPGQRPVEMAGREQQRPEGPLAFAHGNGAARARCRRSGGAAEVRGGCGPPVRPHHRMAHQPHPLPGTAPPRHADGLGPPRLPTHPRRGGARRTRRRDRRSDHRAVAPSTSRRSASALDERP